MLNYHGHVASKVLLGGRHQSGLCILSLLLMTMTGHAASSPTTQPAQGQGGPAAPLEVTLDQVLTVGQTSTVSADGYSDPDGDPFARWQVEWRSAASGAGSLLGSDASYTPTNTSPVYVRVRALASWGFPIEQLTGAWQEVMFIPSAPLPDFGAGCAQGTVTTAGLTYTCPLTPAVADANGIDYSGTHTENGTYGPAGQTYIMQNWSLANAYCTNLGHGYRLPSQSELIMLHSVKGNMFMTAGWPSNYYYWTSTPYNASDYWYVFLDDGSTYGSISSYSNYVSCVRVGT